MPLATAVTTAEVRPATGSGYHDVGPYQNLLSRHFDSKLIGRYLRFVDQATPSIARLPDVDIRLPSPPAPSWLEAVKSGIQKSVVLDPQGIENDGSWITQPIANAATDLLERIADLLPERPQFYSSHDGDLIAEMSAGPRRHLTAAVSQNYVIFFGTVGARIFEKRVQGDVLREGLRSQFSDLMSAMLTAPDADVEASR